MAAFLEKGDSKIYIFAKRKHKDKLYYIWRVGDVLGEDASRSKSSEACILVHLREREREGKEQIYCK